MVAGRAIGPIDMDIDRPAGRSQPDRHRQFALRLVAPRRADTPSFDAGRRLHRDEGPDRVGIGPGTGQPHPHPVMTRGLIVPQEAGLRPAGGEDQVAVAVAVDVGRRHAAADERPVEVGSHEVGRGRAELGRFSGATVPKQLRRLLVELRLLDLVDVLLEMAVGSEDVETAIEIDIGEEDTEGQLLPRLGAEAVGHGIVLELHLAPLGDIERVHLVGEVADDDPDLVVIAEAGDVDPHRATGLPLDVVGDAGEVAHLLEPTVARVAEEEVLHGVVGDDDIERPITVEIVKRQPERLPHRNAGSGIADTDACLLGGISESPRPVIAQKPREGAAEVLRAPVGPAATDEPKVLGAVDVARPGDVIAHEQIEIAVAVGIEPATTRPPIVLIPRHAGVSGDIGESPRAEIAKQSVGPDGTHEQIPPAVGIEIAHGDAGAVEGDVEPRAGSDVAKLSRAIVVVELHRRRRLRGLPLVPGPTRSLDEKQILIAVAVVIEKRAPAPHRLGKELLAGRAVLMDEIDAGGRRDIGERHGRHDDLRLLAARGERELRLPWRRRGGFEPQSPRDQAADDGHRDDQRQ